MSAFSSGSGPALDAQGLHFHFHLSIPPQFTEALAMGARPLRLWAEPPEPAENPPENASRTLDTISSVRPEAAPEPLSPDEFPRFPQAERIALGRLTLLEFYEACVLPWRNLRIEEGYNKPASRDTEWGHCRAWDRWDRQRSPNGTPIEDISADDATAFLADHVAAGKWTPKGAKTRWWAVRQVLNYAATAEIIKRVPKIAPKRAKTIARSAVRPSPRKRPFDDEQLAKLYESLPGVIAESQEVRDGEASILLREMRAAIVLLMNVGARSSDWLRFEFGTNVCLESPAMCYFEEMKNETRDVEEREIPLALVTVKHLEPLRRPVQQQLIDEPATRKRKDTFVFNHLVTPWARTPKESKPHRRANRIVKAAIAAIGLNPASFRHPWHTIRAVCTTRFNDLTMGVGKLITHGKDDDVAGQHYDYILSRMRKAIEAVDWPDVMVAGAGLARCSGCRRIIEPPPQSPPLCVTCVLGRG